MSELELPEAKFFPWQLPQKSQLLKQIDENRLPHAILLTGVPDIGKKAFAFAMGSQLLCKDPKAGLACNSCAACRLLQAGSHPDLRIVRPEKSKLIVVAQIRDLIDWANQTSQQGGAKVAILYPAEKMNVQSANALLKCLEEPGSRSFFLLVTDQPGRLLSTIRSRCQKVEFPVPRKEDAIEWLQANTEPGADISLLLALALGAPLKVVDRYDVEFLARRSEIALNIEKIILGEQSPVVATTKLLNKNNPLEVYEVLYSIFSDALRMQVIKSDKVIINNDKYDVINVISNKFEISIMLVMIDMISECRSTVTGSSNLNPQLLLESLLIKFGESAAS
jgi:DNA polymerase-3 subunit delta'